MLMCFPCTFFSVFSHVFELKGQGAVDNILTESSQKNVFSSVHVVTRSVFGVLRAWNAAVVHIPDPPRRLSVQAKH